jgi:WD40 repeat protein
MRRQLIFHLFLSLLALSLSNHAKAADFTCVAPPALGKLVKATPGWSERIWEPQSAYIWEGKDEHDCRRVAIEGKITSGDADRLESLLTERSHSPEFLLQSPGGNLLESITMGRLLRASFASIETMRNECGGPGQAVCCASACALIYLGAARWNPGDLLGLHRPTLEDLGEEDYSKARTALEGASVLTQRYLKEMEIDGRVFDNMMRTGPEQLAIWTVLKNYPPSLQDWLMAKCRDDDAKDTCMRKKLRNLSDGQSLSNYEEAKRFSWYSYKSKSELKKMLADYEMIGKIRRTAIEAELEKRRKIPDPDRSLVRTLTGHAEDVNAISMTNDGRYALSGNSPPSVKLWDLSNGQELRSLSGHYLHVFSVAMTSDGRYGVSGAPGDLKFWDLMAGRELRTFKVGSDVYHVAISSDGRYGLSAGLDRALKYWDLQNGVALRTLTGHTEPISSIAFCGDGRRGVSTGVDAVKFWDLPTGQEVRSFVLDVRAKDTTDSDWNRKKFYIRFSVAADCRRGVSGDSDGTIKVWDLSNGTEISAFAAHKQDVRSISISADGRYAISGGCFSYDEDKACDAGSLKLWDLATGKLVHEFLGHKTYVEAIAITPDARLALSSSDNALKLWDLSEWTQLPNARP